MFIITAVEKEPQEKKVEKELKEDYDKDELNDLKITRKILENSIEDKFNDESDVIEQKNLRFSKIEKYHC